MMFTGIKKRKFIKKVIIIKKKIFSSNLIIIMNHNHNIYLLNDYKSLKTIHNSLKLVTYLSKK